MLEIFKQQTDYYINHVESPFALLFKKRSSPSYTNDKKPIREFSDSFLFFEEKGE